MSEDCDKNFIQQYQPKVCQYEDAIKCDNCLVFNFDCSNCYELLSDEATTVGQLFATVRLWEPSVQTNMDRLVEFLLAKGVHPDDRDLLTDM